VQRSSSSALLVSIRVLVADKFLADGIAGRESDRSILDSPARSQEGSASRGWGFFLVEKPVENGGFYPGKAVEMLPDSTALQNPAHPTIELFLYLEGEKHV
jgi:hypothetical protein